MTLPIKSLSDFFLICTTFVKAGEFKIALTNAQHLEIFPTYDDQPGVDDYITGLDNSAEAYFKTTTGLLGFLRPKSQIFSQFIVKFRLDNTTGIRYLNPSRLLPQYG